MTTPSEETRGKVRKAWRVNRAAALRQFDAGRNVVQLAEEPPAPSLTRDTPPPDAYEVFMLEIDHNRAADRWTVRFGDFVLETGRYTLNGDMRYGT